MRHWCLHCILISISSSFISSHSPLGENWELSHLRIFYYCCWTSHMIFSLTKPVCLLSHLYPPLGLSLNVTSSPSPFWFLGLNRCPCAILSTMHVHFHLAHHIATPCLMTIFPARLQNLFGPRNAEKRLVLFTITSQLTAKYLAQSTYFDKHLLNKERKVRRSEVLSPNVTTGLLPFSSQF